MKLLFLLVLLILFLSYFDFIVLHARRISNIHLIKHIPIRQVQIIF